MTHTLKRMPMNFMISLVFFLFLACATPAQAIEFEQHSNPYESDILAIIDSLQTGQLEAALTKTNKHLSNYPTSRLGHLIKADILQAMSSELLNVGGLAPGRKSVIDGLKKQLRNRWNHQEIHRDFAEKLYPSSLIDMGRHKHVLVADMTAGRIYLYLNDQGTPKLLRDYYLTIGADGYGKQIEGDNKTPVGVYSIYRHIASSQLPDLYGDGAFPVNYPNRIDRYRQRTGYGIWLHGTPSDTYSRSPNASEGCFVLSNADLNDISQYIDVDGRTPVILSDSITWLSKQELVSEQAEYAAVLNAWRLDWENLDTSAYLTHYSENNFNLGRDNFSRWASTKKQTNSRKTFVQVDLDIESLFVYPGEQDMFVVSFKQRYLSNNFESESNKEQYWQRDASGKWRIIYEG